MAMVANIKRIEHLSESLRSLVSTDFLRGTKFVCKDGVVQGSSLLMSFWSDLIWNAIRDFDCEPEVLHLPDLRVGTLLKILTWSVEGKTLLSRKEFHEITSSLVSLGISVGFTVEAVGGQEVTNSEILVVESEPSALKGSENKRYRARKNGGSSKRKEAPQNDENDNHINVQDKCKRKKAKPRNREKLDQLPIIRLKKLSESALKAACFPNKCGRDLNPKTSEPSFIDNTEEQPQEHGNENIEKPRDASIKVSNDTGICLSSLVKNTEKRKWQCPLCPAVGNVFKTLAAHLIMVHYHKELVQLWGRAPLDFPCPYCERRLLNGAAITMEKWMARDDKVKPAKIIMHLGFFHEKLLDVVGDEARKALESYSKELSNPEPTVSKDISNSKPTVSKDISNPKPIVKAARKAPPPVNTDIRDKAWEESVAYLKQTHPSCDKCQKGPKNFSALLNHLSTRHLSSEALGVFGRDGGGVCRICGRQLGQWPVNKLAASIHIAYAHKNAFFDVLPNEGASLFKTFKKEHDKIIDNKYAARASRKRAKHEKLRAKAARATFRAGKAIIAKERANQVTVHELVQDSELTCSSFDVSDETVQALEHHDGNKEVDEPEILEIDQDSKTKCNESYRKTLDQPNTDVDDEPKLVEVVKDSIEESDNFVEEDFNGNSAGSEPCPFCSKSFPTTYHLRRHLCASHFKKELLQLAGDQSVDDTNCPKCGRSIGHEGMAQRTFDIYLAIHIGTKHKLLKLVFPKDVVDKLALDEDPNINPTCTLCKPTKQFRIISHLKMHLSVTHFREKLLRLADARDLTTCPLCQVYTCGNTKHLNFRMAGHIGTSHDLLYDVLPEEMKRKLMKMERQKKHLLQLEKQ